MTVRLGASAAAVHFATAFGRHLASTRLLSAIAMFGLVIGLTAAILMMLAARTALAYNDFIPGHDRIHLGISVLSGPGMAPDYNESTNGRAAALFASNSPEVEAVARLAEEEVELRRGNRSVRRNIYWADPGTFEMLRVPVLSGDPVAALARPDGVVMTRREALRHFGRDDALGDRIEIAGVVMVLRAVIADLPEGSTDLANGIFASGLAARSTIAASAEDEPGSFTIGVRTYIRLRPEASAEQVEQAMAPFIDAMLPAPMRGAYAMRLVRIDRLALHEGFHPGARERLAIGSLVAALILFIALANFINVGVALSIRRRREIGVRKMHGAGRGQIALQFLAEAVVTVFVAALLAMAAVELLLPTVNGFLGTRARLDFVADPSLGAWLLAGVLALGLVAGAYPALVMARLSPVQVMKDLVVGPGRAFVRNLLVTGQFAILIGLIVATAVVFQQRSFALHDALRADVDQVLTIAAPCPAGFRQEVAKLEGVEAVSCHGGELLTGDIFAFVESGGRRVSADIVSIFPSTFALYGIAPVAGSLAGLPAEGEEQVSRIVINEAAVREFGLGSPAAALGRILPVPSDQPGSEDRARIVAVVPDFSFSSVETAIEPTLYVDRAQYPGGEGLVAVKLAASRIPETLAAIDRLWRSTGQDGPIERAFVDEHVEALYRDLERNTQLLALFAGVAAFLACLGLVGLSTLAVERRTKEMGIRKALGARTGQILMLLLWQLSRPVLWANLIAWPVAWWLLQDWLAGFAYHVPLHLWLFPAAGLAAFIVAVASIGLQCFLVARQKPIHALRYE